MNFYRYPLPIETAIIDYRTRFGTYPLVMAVNPHRLTTANRALDNMNLNVTVQLVGGCLADEVWLNIPEATEPQNGDEQLTLF